MFTGIIKGLGIVSKINVTEQSATITVQTSLLDTWQTTVGDSIAVNGVCLTVTKLITDQFTVDVMPETMRVTSLKSLKVGGVVNLEPALRLTDRLDGHVVQGHVDTTAKLKSVEPQQNSSVLTFEFDDKYAPLIVTKGSIAIDGVSLTVVNVTINTFSVSLIPFTLAHTSLESRRIGEAVNIETDVLSKYVLKQQGVTI